MLKWCKDNNIEWNKELDIYYSDSCGNSVRAKNDIDAGTLLVSVPEEVLIHIYKSFSLDLSSIIPLDKLINKLDNIQRLVFQINFEKSLGDKSKWYHYLNDIPKQYDTTSMYTDEEIDDLVYPYYKEEAHKLRKEMFDSYNGFKSIIDEHIIIDSDTVSTLDSKHGIDLKVLKDTILDLDLFKWSWAVIQTRTYYFNNESYLKNHEKEIKTTSNKSNNNTNSNNNNNQNISSTKSHDNACLVPMADLFNHDSRVTTKALFNEKERCFQVFTETEFKAGEQVYISYGLHSNATLLHFYGFVIDNNPLDSIIIPNDTALPLNLIKSPAMDISFKNDKEKKDFEKLFERKNQILFSNGLSIQGKFELVNDSTLPFTWNYLTVLRVLFMNEKELHLEKHLNIFYKDDPISKVNEKLLSNFLVQLCDKHLDLLESDLNKSKNNTTNIRPHILEMNKILKNNAISMWKQAKQFSISLIK